MKNLLQKIKLTLLGPPDDPGRTGYTLSSNAPESKPSEPKSEFMSKPRPIGFEITIDEPKPEPDGDGWIRLPNGDRYRKIKCGSAAMGSEMLEDEPTGPRRRQIVSINGPFDKKRDEW